MEQVCHILEVVRKSFFHMCAVTVGTDVYSCEVRIHLLTPLGVGNNIHGYIRTKSNFICICAVDLELAQLHLETERV